MRLVRSRSSSVRCPFCREALAATDARTCPGCHTRQHEACASELGRCTTLGCHAPVESPLDRPLEVTCVRCRSAIADDQGWQCSGCLRVLHRSCGLRGCPRCGLVSIERAAIVFLAVFLIGLVVVVGAIAAKNPGGAKDRDDDTGVYSCF